MGFTRYMVVPSGLSSFPKTEFPDDFRRAVQGFLEITFTRQGIRFEIAPKEIIIAGDSDDNTCETFVLPTWSSILDIPGNDYVISKKTGDIQLFTKTNRLPYDRAICGVMVLAMIFRRRS